MSSNITRGAGSAFRIRRPLITTSGFVSATDSTVAKYLKDLNGLLQKRIFDPAAEAGVAAAKGLDPATLLKANLSPKRTPGSATWEPDSLGDRLRDGRETDTRTTLGEYIDKTADLSELRYELDELLLDSWPTLTPNTRAVLDDEYPAIRDYLSAYAYLFKGVKEVNGLKNFVFGSTKGAARLIEYAAVSAGRDVIKRKALDVDKLNEDDSPIVESIKSAVSRAKHPLALTSTSFETELLAIVGDNVFDGKYYKVLAAASIGEIPLALKPKLVQLMKGSPVEVTNQNVNYFVSHWIAEIDGMSPSSMTDPPSTPEESAQDFFVEFFEDDRSMVQVSEAAVTCAAMLYYSMVAGDELPVFETVNYFTHKYLIRGGVEVTDHRLREDLQSYVFSNRFTDLNTGEVLDRTRPAERQMFYRQVFAVGKGPMVEDSIVNVEFPRHWKILMLESAEYLERAQDSPNPDSFVSRQKVAQAVEDLQYNLSTHCTGMANVITPLIYAELNFVIRRIFMHPEVLRQVTPVGSTWWRVVEKLYTEMKHARPKVTVLYNKAKLGHDIIASIADYNPATFEDDASFSAFISSVDAFITTQSILQDALKQDLVREPEDEAGPEEPAATPAPVPVAAGPPSASNGTAPSDDWDF